MKLVAVALSAIATLLAVLYGARALQQWVDFPVAALVSASVGFGLWLAICTPIVRGATWQLRPETKPPTKTENPKPLEEAISEYKSPQDEKAFRKYLESRSDG